MQSSTHPLQGVDQVRGHYSHMRDESPEAQENRELRAALVDLLKVAPHEVGCRHMHHAKNDRHRYDVDCPVVSRYVAALTRCGELIK